MVSVGPRRLRRDVRCQEEPPQVSLRRGEQAAMDIPFASRSKFLAICQETIRTNRDQLEKGLALRIVLEPGGYEGHITVTIRGGNSTGFSSDWASSDPTRFPARIKAAATALRDCSCFGTFIISHSDGSLSIRRI